jgi:hypothetical protein
MQCARTWMFLTRGVVVARIYKFVVFGRRSWIVVFFCLFSLSLFSAMKKSWFCSQTAYMFIVQCVLYQDEDSVKVPEEKHGDQPAEPEVPGVVALPAGEPRLHAHPPDKLVDELNVKNLKGIK